MKQISRFCYAMIAIVIIALSSVSVHAETAEIDGVYYNLRQRGTSKGSASVIAKPDGTKYSGNIVIPNGFSYNEISYTVSGIADTAFIRSPQLISVKIETTGIKSIPKELFCGCTALETVVLGDRITNISDWAFAGCSSLKNIDLSGIRRIGEYAFIDCSSLKSVEFPQIEYINERAFLGCDGLTSVVLPAIDYTESGAKYVFANCGNIKEVILSEGITSIANGMFACCSAIEKINFPSSLRSIGDEAFYGCNKLTSPVFNEGLLTIGNDAFTGITELHIPSTLYSIGNGVCLNTRLKSITIAEGCENFVLKNNGLYSKDEKKLFFVLANPYTGSKEIKDETLEEIMSGAYIGTGITSIELGENFSRLGYNAFPETLTSLSCKSYYPPIYISSSDESVADAYVKNCTLIVPQGSLWLYKNDEYWGKFKSIVGNSEWTSEGGVKTAMPHGLYFAKKDGNICYHVDGETHDTGISAGAHPFNMQTFGSSVYVADAGKEHMYKNDAGNNLGDGSLYKVEKVGDKFMKTTVLHPQGHDEDPYTCWIDKTAGELYSTNRNKAAYTIDIKGLNRYVTSEAPVFCTWQNLPCYNYGLSYGAACTAFFKDSNGVYWQSFAFNGNCIIRYKAEEIGTNERNYSMIGTGERFLAMYLDETNGYLYAYAYNQMTGKTELRRVLINSDDISRFSYWVLIDDAPDYCIANSLYDCNYVKQITGDGKNIYWSYIADEASVDTSNPLHKSGIKMIPATGDPVVTYAVPDVEAYGLAFLSEEEAGIENIITPESIETGTVEYYNLQGIRVNNPSNGIFIKRQGNKVIKVVM